MSWDDVSYVIGSKRRKAIVVELESPRTPSMLASDLNMNLANVSRALVELENKGIVACLTPKKRVGKIYSLTKKGKDVLAKIRKMEQK